MRFHQRLVVSSLLLGSTMTQQPVYSVSPGGSQPVPTQGVMDGGFVVAGNQVYFLGDTHDGAGMELRVSDGDPASTRLVYEDAIGPGGKFQGYRGVGQDVTAHKEAEQALNASESQLAAIIDAAMDAIITVDGYHNIVVFNEFAAGMFGCRRTDALSSPLVRFLPECAQAIAAAGGTTPGTPAPVAVRARAMTALRAKSLAH